MNKKQNFINNLIKQKKQKYIKFLKHIINLKTDDKTENFGEFINKYLKLCDDKIDENNIYTNIIKQLTFNEISYVFDIEKEIINDNNSDHNNLLFFIYSEIDEEEAFKILNNKMQYGGNKKLMEQTNSILKKMQGFKMPNIGNFLLTGFFKIKVFLVEGYLTLIIGFTQTVSGITAACVMILPFFDQLAKLLHINEFFEGIKDKIPFYNWIKDKTLDKTLDQNTLENYKDAVNSEDKFAMFEFSKGVITNLPIGETAMNVMLWFHQMILDLYDFIVNGIKDSLKHMENSNDSGIEEPIQQTFKEWCWESIQENAADALVWFLGNLVAGATYIFKLISSVSIPTIMKIFGFCKGLSIFLSGYIMSLGAVGPLLAAITIFIIFTFGSAAAAIILAFILPFLFDLGPILNKSLNINNKKIVIHENASVLTSLMDFIYRFCFMIYKLVFSIKMDGTNIKINQNGKIEINENQVNKKNTFQSVCNVFFSSININLGETPYDHFDKYLEQKTNELDFLKSNTNILNYVLEYTISDNLFKNYTIIENINLYNNDNRISVLHTALENTFNVSLCTHNKKSNSKNLENNNNLDIKLNFILKLSIIFILHNDILIKADNNIKKLFYNDLINLCNHNIENIIEKICDQRGIFFTTHNYAPNIRDKQDIIKKKLEEIKIKQIEEEKKEEEKKEEKKEKKEKKKEEEEKRIYYKELLFVIEKKDIIGKIFEKVYKINIDFKNINDEIQYLKVFYLLVINNQDEYDNFKLINSNFNKELPKLSKYFKLIEESLKEFFENNNEDKDKDTVNTSYLTHINDYINQNFSNEKEYFDIQIHKFYDKIVEFIEKYEKYEGDKLDEEENDDEKYKIVKNGLEIYEIFIILDRFYFNTDFIDFYNYILIYFYNNKNFLINEKILELYKISNFDEQLNIMCKKFIANTYKNKSYLTNITLKENKIIDQYNSSY